MVTTGQQAGFLTGPLYTLHKALSVARLAEALEAELGIPVLPVFWTASEDHDWAEVNHAFLLDAADHPRRVELPSSQLLPVPMHERELEEQLKQSLDEVEEVLRALPFASDVLTSIRDAYQPGRSVSDAFSRLLADLLSPFDLLLTDAADPHLKQASAPVLRRALEEAQAHAELLRERGQRLLQEGYHAQVTVVEGATNLFYHGSGHRERIDRQGDGFVLHDSGTSLDSAGLLAELDADPGRFSPNALLRPVVESAVFPTLGYVAGPGEISYFAQATALFRAFEMEPPVVFPRFSVTLVEPAIQRLLGRLRLSATDLARPRHELATRLAREAMPGEVRASLTALGESVAEGYRRLIEQSGQIDPTLRGSLGALRNETLARLDDAERRIVQRLRERESVALAQMDRVRGHLRPEGQPQERVLNAVPYLARYGPDLLRRILDEMSIAWTDDGVPQARAVPDAPG